MEKKRQNCISIITIVEWRDHHWIFDVIKHGLFVLPVLNVPLTIGSRWQRAQYVWLILWISWNDYDSRANHLPHIIRWDLTQIWFIHWVLLCCNLVRGMTLETYLWHIRPQSSQHWACLPKHLQGRQLLALGHLVNVLYRLVDPLSTVGHCRNSI